MRMRLTAVATAAFLVMGTAAADARASDPPESYPVPNGSTITITGHGFGHGHGMGQYGAQGAALQGKTWQAIVGFYYPGTARSTLGGKVSVHLTGDTSPGVVVVARPGLRVHRVGASHWWTPRHPAATKWRITGVRGHRSKVSFFKGHWRLWKVLPGDAEFDAKGRPVTLITPAGRVAYRGTLRSASLNPSGSPRVTVNVVSLESYVRGVVPREMPSSWKPAALAAQAVAARTYAAFERAQPLSSAYQICDTTACQVYGGYSAEVPSTNAAVAATAKQVLTYQGKPAFTQFSASTGGWNAAGSQPYLVAQPDPYDDNPFSDNATTHIHTWDLTVTQARMEHFFPAIGNLTSFTVNSRDGNGDWGGRIQSITMSGDKGSVTLSGDDFRARLGLRSTWLGFSVT